MIDAHSDRSEQGQRGWTCPPIPAIATHDEKRIAFAKQYAEKVGLPREALEFQMLYGIRRDLQEQLVKQGYPVRVYVPFGTHWYPYFMRRLAERPATSGSSFQLLQEINKYTSRQVNTYTRVYLSTFSVYNFSHVPLALVTARHIDWEKSSP